MTKKVAIYCCGSALKSAFQNDSTIEMPGDVVCPSARDMWQRTRFRRTRQSLYICLSFTSQLLPSITRLQLQKKLEEKRNTVRYASQRKTYSGTRIIRNMRRGKEKRSACQTLSQECDCQIETPGHSNRKQTSFPSRLKM